MARHLDDDPADETVVVDRDADAETVLVDREAEVETIVVDRGGESTETIDRITAEETATADRDADIDAETLVVDRGADGIPDRTVAVTRARSRRSAETPAPRRGGRRRGMTMPPAAPGTTRHAIDAVGPGAVSSYAPRPLPGPPPASLDLGGVAPTRVAAPGLPSVERRSRRGGMIALAAFVLACVVSVVGLVALGIAVLG